MSTSSRTTTPIPTFIPDEIQHRKNISAWIREANQGKIMNVGNVTLAASAATTVVKEPRAGANSFIGLMPTTANAASAVGAGSVYISSQSAQAFTITHANNATADRTFRYCILG